MKRLTMRCTTALALTAITLLASQGASAKRIDPAAQSALATPATVCGSETLTQPFLPWSDPALYALLPNGGFENGASGWTLAGAAITTGNEPSFLNAPTDTWSLSLPSGASALSSPICAGLDYPHMRFFATSSCTRKCELDVEVLAYDHKGNARLTGIAKLKQPTAWAPTEQVSFLRLLTHTLAPGETTSIAFRFTTKGEGTWQIDDIYVDPFRAR